MALSSAIVPESQRKEETRIRYNFNTCSRTILSACNQIHPKTTRSLQPLLIDVFRGTGSVGWDAKERVDFPRNFSNLRMKQMTGGILDYGSTQTDFVRFVLAMRRTFHDPDGRINPSNPTEPVPS